MMLNDFEVDNYNDNENDFIGILFIIISFIFNVQEQQE